MTFVGLLCLLLLSSCETNVPKGTPDTEAPHTHAYRETVVPPTCSEDGYTLHRCSLCDAQYSDQTVKALGHTYRESVQDALCNEYQKKLLECSVCEYTSTEDLEEKGTIHTYVSTVTHPDRENKGYTTHSCQNCTDSYVDSFTDSVNYSVGLAYTKQSQGYYVSGMGTCKDTDVIVPLRSEQGYQVVGIAQNAFANTQVKSVTVSNGVTDIQTGAFYDCTALEEVTMSQSAIPAENIFANNPVLEKLTMPMSKPLSYYFTYRMVTSGEYKAVQQGDGSYFSTYQGSVPTSLKEVNLLSAPCISAFMDCDMLTKITIASNTTHIGISAFRNCTGLTEFSIPSSVRTIGRYAFAATSITSITIPDSVDFTYENESIFEGCSQLTQVTLPKRCTFIPSYMFLNCSKLQQLEIPNSVTALGVCFMVGTAIESLTLPNGMTALDPNAFNGCQTLKEVVLPKNLKTIYYSAFENCTALKKVVFSTNLEEIEHDAFKGCSALEEITLPASLKKIGYAAFKNCAALHSVELPTSIATIPYELFFGCTSLQQITLPNTVTYIQYSAFEESGLISVTIPENLTKIGARVFANCTSLKSVAFAGDNCALGDSMFLGATALESISLPKNTVTVPIGFCQGATALKTIAFNEGLLYIKDDAFLGCTAIESITFPTTLRSIGQNAFKDCTALQSVDFSGANMSEEGVKVGINWFSGCTALTEVKNFNQLENANDSIFYNTPFWKNYTESKN